MWNAPCFCHCNYTFKSPIFFLAARFANELPCWQRAPNVLQKVFVKEFISGASCLALLPKDVSWMVTENFLWSENSQGIYFIQMKCNIDLHRQLLKLEICKALASLELTCSMTDIFFRTYCGKWNYCST